MTAKPTDYPYEDTRATQMLASAFRKAWDEKRLSQRKLAKQLGYRSSVVLSHMASGRAPIPIERVDDYAHLLEMDEGEFLLAVLEQRYPHLDFRNMGAKTEPQSDDGLLEELELIAGQPLSSLAPNQMNVVREALADHQAQRRWLSLNELPVMEFLRHAFPGLREKGLDQEQRQHLHACLESRSWS